jgi:hypothetical protein
MIEEVKVKIAKEEGTKSQWAKSLFYTLDARKYTLDVKLVMWSTGIIFAFMAIVLLLRGTPEDDSPKSTNAIQIPDTQSAQPKINIPDMGEVAKIGPNPAGQAQKQMRFLGPQLVVSTGLHKIPPGSTVKAILLTAGTDGLVRAKAIEPLNINGEAKFDEGTLFLGTGSSTEDRLKIDFKQMVFLDGTFETISAQAFDESDQMLGLQGSKLGNEAIKLGASIGLNFAAGLSEGLQDSDVQGGMAIRKPSLRNAMLNGAATAALEQSREMMSDFKNRHSAISVPQGKHLLIMFEGN